MREIENRLVRMTTLSQHAWRQPQTILMTSGALRRGCTLLTPGFRPAPLTPPSPHPSLATTTLLVRGSVIRWLSLSQVAQVTEACPTLVLIAPWGIIDKTQGALHVGL